MSDVWNDTRRSLEFNIKFIESVQSRYQVHSRVVFSHPTILFGSGSGTTSTMGDGRLGTMTLWRIPLISSFC
jgi:hypothetical protein